MSAITTRWTPSSATLWTFHTRSPCAKETANVPFAGYELIRFHIIITQNGVILSYEIQLVMCDHSHTTTMHPTM